MKQLAGQIGSPIDLVRAGGPFAVTANGSTASYFTDSLDPIAAALLPRWAARQILVFRSAILPNCGLRGIRYGAGVALNARGAEQLGCD